MNIMSLFRGPVADPISDDDLADLSNFRLPPPEPEPEGIQAQTLVKAEAELILLTDRERREQEGLDTLTEALRQTRIAKRSVEAMIAVLSGPQLAYDPADDSAESYTAALEAKRQRGDTHFTRKPADGGANISTKHILPAAE